MISFFGLLSLAVLIICIIAMYQHFKLMQIRGALDDGFAKLDEALRVRLDIIYEIGLAAPEPDGLELCETCENICTAETRQIINELPKLQKAALRLIVEDREEREESLAENAGDIESSAGNYNKQIEKFNEYIKKNPAKLMAAAIGLRPEKPVSLSITQ